MRDRREERRAKREERRPCLALLELPQRLPSLALDIRLEALGAGVVLAGAADALVHRAIAEADGAHRAPGCAPPSTNRRSDEPLWRRMWGADFFSGGDDFCRVPRFNCASRRSNRARPRANTTAHATAAARPADTAGEELCARGQSPLALASTS